ncbi:response regulator transcription factor [Colwellia sp. 4_MG-2023]|uniref:response regulator transcription factor n=1 Tax=unclassified Colwellia TaxID=196834 RepID=UPI001C08AD7F|nr:MULTISPECIES: response regulator transcription factor [unclassified Colwellia]MBU2924886.1 response regulator transcription factor [Colwellia sp. C2M11]MDO6506785.1 response regulator transcription factor [Colwellia sp. 5_MG-2023]MDO6555840.1 response regulator transcription factor [Colwellia sp. 4_MG-2023]MDO6652884.1 response regulator transcription factor [Colwellia sp. 3_MG-2023]MDO6665886.1 response regulator transcription factor [Colwellia sp. 2_MG-2023]
MNILLVEDSDKLRRSLRIGLVALGFAVDEAGDGADALAMALSDDYDIIILDLMLPSVDGLSILKSLRKHKKQSKVLILSAKDQLSDRIDGLFTGADDYMTKPFSFDELHARIIALTRRGELLRTSNTITINDFVVDLQAKVLSFSGKAIDLTPTEYKITECLFINKEKVVSAEKMGEYIVGKYDAINKNSLEAHISSIRKKLKKFSAVFPVKNKRGFGYVATNA